mmetsp:Transcript_3188/g.9300  ORF Transcript_3188/g.9300 Transcript_3188/m.9300 type:complete len:305 (+) Transcript_3188:503-1417(+)
MQLQNPIGSVQVFLINSSSEVLDHALLRTRGGVHPLHGSVHIVIATRQHHLQLSVLGGRLLTKSSVLRRKKRRCRLQVVQVFLASKQVLSVLVSGELGKPATKIAVGIIDLLLKSLFTTRRVAEGVSHTAHLLLQRRHLFHKRPRNPRVLCAAAAQLLVLLRHTWRKICAQAVFQCCQSVFQSVKVTAVVAFLFHHRQQLAELLPQVPVCALHKRFQAIELFLTTLVCVRERLQQWAKSCPLSGLIFQELDTRTEMMHGTHHRLATMRKICLRRFVPAPLHRLHSVLHGVHALARRHHDGEADR